MDFKNNYKLNNLQLILFLIKILKKSKNNLYLQHQSSHYFYNLKSL